MTRGLAALGVIWGHAIYMMDAPLALNGAFWVWVFLPLSGYLVSRSFDVDGYARTIRGSLHFLWNRMLRIVPLALLALLLGVVIVLAGGATLPPDVVRQFLFVPRLNKMSLVGPLWTIAAELQFYVVAVVLVPLIRIAWQRGGVVAGVLIWAGATMAGHRWILTVGDNPVQPRTMIGNASFFVLGVVLAQPDRPIISSPRWAKVSLVIMTVGTAWYLENYKPHYFWAWGSHKKWPLGGAAACAMVLVAIVLLTEIKGVNGQGLRSSIGRALAWCGFYCYGIYVAHSVLAAANNTLWQIGPGWLLLAVLSCAVPIAPLTYRYFERWWLRMKLDRPSRQAPSIVAEDGRTPVV